MEPITSTAVIAVTLGLVQIIKSLTSEKIAPILALIVGIGCSYLTATLPGAEPFNHSLVIFSGLVYGLSAMGLYSGSKSVKETIQG